MASVTTSPTPSFGKRVWSRRNRNYLVAFLFILPALINFCIFRYYPIVSAMWTSLWEYSLLGGYGDLVGLQHYIDAIGDAGFYPQVLLGLIPSLLIYLVLRWPVLRRSQAGRVARWTLAVGLAAMTLIIWRQAYFFLVESGDKYFWNSMWVTVKYVIMKVPIQILLSLFLAVMVQREVLGMGVVRSAIFTPVVTSIIVVAILWSMMYHVQQGLINSIIASLGFQRVAFLSDAKRALPSIAAMHIWKDVGFTTLILMAGLKGIPTEFYEAALVDGANRWQVFRRITVPLLRRVILFVVVTQTIFTFQVFEPVYAMVQPAGGPLHSTEVIVFYIYKNGFRMQRMDYASALSVILLFIILGISLVEMRLLRSEVEY
ncbi:MAG: carbohydrate ABC transporter permease [Chloroflexota bacterium]